jgi:uncharacterized membrane protein
MFKIMLALHLLTAIFAIGPLVGAATTASRGLRKADAGAIGSSTRTLTVYGYASVVVVVLGMGLMSSKLHGKTVADMGDVWIWLSLLLWLATLGLLFGLTLPTLKKASATAGAGSAGEALKAMTGKVAASGGLIGLIYAAIVFLMVYRPGS